MSQAEAELHKERGALGRIIAPRLMNNVKRNLGLPVNGDVIDLPALDVNNLSQATPVQMPAVRQSSFMDRLKAAGQVLVNPVPVVMHQYQATAPAPIANPPTPVDDPKPEPTKESKGDGVFTDGMDGQ